MSLLGLKVFSSEALALVERYELSDAQSDQSSALLSGKSGDWDQP